MARKRIVTGGRTWLSPYEFHAVPWVDLVSTYREISASDASMGPLLAIVESVVASPARDLIVGRSSSHVYDLNVAAVQVAAPPTETIIVRTSRSIRHASKPGSVVIEHCSATGRDDRIERPADEAVALFWRFVFEKFGVQSR